MHRHFLKRPSRLWLPRSNLSAFPLTFPCFLEPRWNLPRLVSLPGFISCFSPVLGIHKLPANAATDITFPMKGWRGMVDWAKNSEDKVTVSKSILSSGLSGRQHSQHKFIFPSFSKSNSFRLPGLQILFQISWICSQMFGHQSIDKCK